MNIGIFGSGNVAQTLGAGFLRHGHAVLLASRAPEKLAPWAAAHPGGRTGTFAEAAAFGEVLVLAVRGSAAAEPLRQAHAPDLQGKVVLDATNPIADGPPENGVLPYFTNLEESLLERLQRAFPEVRFVKAFSSVGASLMVNPDLPGGPPTMFICGQDSAAKTLATSLLDQFGWETEDLGGVEAARAIEPLAMLWCLPGFLRNDWVHAFKLLRPAAPPAPAP